MVRWGWRLAAMAVLAAGAARAAPLEVYGKLPTIEEVTISPDGTRLALIVTDGEKRTIRIENLAQHKRERFLQAGDVKLREMRWVGSNHLVVIRSTTERIRDSQGARYEFAQGFDYDVTTGATRALLQDTTLSLNAFYGPETRVVDGKPTLFVRGYHLSGNRTVPTIFRIDADSAKSKIVETGKPGTDGFVLGADGVPVAETEWDEPTLTWSLKMKTAGAWKDVRTMKFEKKKDDRHPLYETPGVVGLGRDGQSVLVTEYRDDSFVMREVSPAGVWSEPLPTHGATSPIFDPVRRNLIGLAELVGDEQHYDFFDPQDQHVWALVEHAYPNQRVRLVSWSDDRHKIVVSADSPDLGPGYALIDLDAHHADWIANKYDRLGPDDISPVKPLRFKASDGLELTGYLTTPRGRPAESLPLVVFPHGGPEARDAPGFDWWAQAMASRGYAVLQVNFRGSSGFGKAFTKAGYGQWGRKMQTDLSDGVRYLAAGGIVDPKRVCIVGASYGGYAAMAGPSLDPGVYRCAVAYAGISDMHSFAPWVGGQDGDANQRYVMRFIGVKELYDAAVSEISPADHIDKVTAPLLLIHGKDDTVVPIEQSRLMASALERAGKPVEFLRLDSTDHWLTRGDTRLSMLTATVAFLEKNNPPH